MQFLRSIYTPTYIKDCTPWSFLPTFGFFSDTWVNYADWHESDLSRSLDNFLKTQPKNYVQGAVLHTSYKKRRSLSRFLSLTWVTWPLKSIHFHKWLHFEITQWVKIILPKKEPIKCLTTLLWIFHNFYVWKCYIVTTMYFIKDFIPVWNTHLLQKKNGFFLL